MDSGIYQNGSNIGLGTTAPASTLDLVGAGTTSATSNLILRDANKSALVTVLDNGNVGIGTTSPGQIFGGGGTALDIVNSSVMSKAVIAGGTAARLFVRDLNGPSNAKSLGLSVDGGFANYYSPSDNESSSVNLVTYNLATGNVGIGTTSPGQIFDIWSGGSTKFNVRNDGVVNVAGEVRNSSMTQTTAGLRWGEPTSYMQLGGASGAGSFANSGSAEIDLNGITSANAGQIIFKTGVSSIANQPEVMRIDSSGNVGINNTIPVSKLDLVGAGTTSATSNLILRDANRSRLVTVLDNGYVGIGSASPSDMLTVYGGGLRLDDGDVSRHAAVIKDGLGNTTFRGLRGNYYWADMPANTTAFQVGASGDNIVFTTATSVIAPRVMMHTTGFQVNAGNFAASTAPAGVFEVSNGAAKLFDILSTGNVGIGSTTPDALLQVGVNPSITTGSAPAAAIKGNLMVDGNIYGNGATITGITGTITGLNAGYLSRANTSTSIVDSGIYQNGSGYIGIGTTNPQSQLTVIGVIRLQHATMLDRYLNLSYETNTSNAYLDFTTGGVASRYFDFRYGGNSRMVLTGAGNLGIGTTVPAAKLHVVGSGTTTGNAFEIDDSLYAPKVTVLDNGNVGIGTTGPGQKLEVDGSIYAVNNVMVGNALADAGNTPRVQITATKIIVNLQ